MKNEHLIPANVLDIVEKISKQTVHENERLNYIARLEAIRDFCNEAVAKHNKEPVVYMNKRKTYRK
jgi:hypothetical protein